MSAPTRTAVITMVLGVCSLCVSACQEVASLDAQVLIDASVRNELCADGCLVKLRYEPRVKGALWSGRSSVLAQLCGKSAFGVLLDARLSFLECPTEGEVIAEVKSLKEEIAAGVIECATLFGDDLDSIHFPSFSEDNILAERRVPVLEGVSPPGSGENERNASSCDVAFPPLLRFGFVSD